MKILFICDCKKGCSSSCGCVLNGGPCSHTADISNAKNYNEVPIVIDNPSFKNISNDYNEACYVEEENNG